eukprot:s2841_g4.t1
MSPQSGSHAKALAWQAAQAATRGGTAQGAFAMKDRGGPVAYHSPSMTLETFLFSFVFGFLVYGGPACDTYVCDDSQLLQRANAVRAECYGAWAFPRDWKTNRDIANVSDFEPITWGSVENQDVLLNFLSAIPVFGEGGNYIALLHGMDHHLAKQLRYLETGELSLFCSGPNGSHRTKVRGLGNETGTAYKIHFVFLCDWPEEDKHLERFEVFLEDGHGKQLGTVVAEQKNGLLQQYRTVACIRDVWPSEKTGLRQLPQWMEFHLLHGVEHFLIYTVNLDSKILVDLYEPYIRTGFATRVHFNKEVVGDDAYHFHARLHHILMADCLYRFKNHATWILPSIDIDEFINMKGRNLFEGGRVPEDYVGSSWDAIVKNSGLQADRVHSIAFNLYRFAQVQPGQVELSSVLREPNLQRNCPKYVLNANNVNTVFIHWVTSWKNGTQGLAVVDKDMLDVRELVVPGIFIVVDTFIFLRIVFGQSIRSQDADYMSGWQQSPWQAEDYPWQTSGSRSPRQRTQSPRQRTTRPKSQKRNQTQYGEEDKGKGKGGKGSGKDFAPQPPSAQWLSPPALPPSVETTIVDAPTSSASTGLASTMSSVPAMQPFPKPKNSTDAELASLRQLHKDLKGKPNLPEDVIKSMAKVEANIRKVDSKSHKQLVDQLREARKKLSQLDDQWEAYRVQWANYIDKASQMWLSHVEAFETGEKKFAERRREAMSHLQQTRIALHDVHQRTMEDGLGGIEVEHVQEALDATMKMEEQEGPETTNSFDHIKAELTGVVQQVKSTIEEKLKKRERSQPPRGEVADVEILEPVNKQARDSH